ncbi:eCIS core domain-containing protein [Duganella rivi]|nr:DUF4157 domain-containing protein [Duganella rivi]
MKVRSTRPVESQRSASATSGTAQKRKATASTHYQDMASNSAQSAQLMERAQMMAGGAPAQLAEDEELLQGKFEAAQLVEDEELLQGKFTAQRAEVQNDSGLPPQLKAGIESMSGMSMDHVNVHYNSDRPAQLNAHAYAQGSDIHVAPGQEQHLPHEAWHVVQQAQGRVQPTTQMKESTPVNDDPGLESEADVMGAKALNIGQAQLKAGEQE